MSDLIIDDATLAAAERLFGIRYTDAERAQMRDNLPAQIDLAVRRRAVKLPNALAPATLFDPRLPGFAMPAQASMNVPRIAPPLPAADDDIAFAPVKHLAAWIAGGQLSAVRLTRIYLDRSAASTRSSSPSPPSPMRPRWRRPNAPTRCSLRENISAPCTASPTPRRT